MRKLRTSLLLLGALAAVHQAHAAIGTVDMSWDACTPIVVDKTTTAAAPVGLVISILGHDEFHQGYEVWGVMGTAARTTPDAWAFDAAGCQTPARITIEHLTPVALSKTCPSFQGAAASIQVKTFDAGAGTGDLNLDPNLRRFVLANAYPSGISTSVASQRYFLARFLFDHSISVVGPGTPGVDCGGLESALCLWLPLPGVLRVNWRRVRPGRRRTISIRRASHGSSVSAKATLHSTTWGTPWVALPCPR
ncbi:MAG: hypothetical protein ACREOU_04395 [Candidatus Eiseniibacteriota bacterium]